MINFPNISLNDQNTFESNGSKYTLVMNFAILDESNPSDTSKYHYIKIDNTNVKSFTWINEINNILLLGELEYNDAKGDVGKFFGTYISFVGVKLIKVSDEKKDDFTEAAEEEVFDHEFIINNYEIIGRTGTIIKYKFYLISSNWFNYMSNIYFSNYDSDDKTIYNSMLNILNIAFKGTDIKCDKKSFSVPSDTLEYCTTCQTTCMDAIKYLQNKLIYNEKFKLNELSFIFYDEFEKTIKLFKLDNKYDASNLKQGNKKGAMLSLTGTESEQYVSKEEQNLKSVIKKSNCLGIKSLFGKIIHKYDIDKNVSTPYEIDSDKLCKIGIENNLNNLNSSVFKSEAVPIFNFNKFKSALKLNEDDKNFNLIGTFDNNNMTVYNELLENITNRNALILETNGEITNCPGQLYCISDDSDVSKSSKDATEEEFIDKNRMLTGIFYIFKARHTISPGSTGGNAFTERLILARLHNAKLQQQRPESES